MRLQPKHYKLQPLFVRLQPKHYKLTPTTLTVTDAHFNCFYGNIIFYFTNERCFGFRDFLIWSLCHNTTYDTQRSCLPQKVSKSINFIFLPETC